MQSILSKNIKYLRKEQSLSQEALAAALGIKRSNITAYETKSVEPRLSMILEMAKFFNISLSDLLSKDISINQEYSAFEVTDNTEGNILEPIKKLDKEELSEFIENSTQIRKILDGFKAFYTFKKNNINKGVEVSSQKLMFEIENFLQLSEHLLEHNESLIKSIRTQSPSL